VIVGLRARQVTRLLAPVAVATAAAGLALLAVACGGSAASGLPVRDSFDRCDGFTNNNETATIDCPNGELRILVSHPEDSPIQIVPFRFDPPVGNLAVEADMRRATGSSANGLGCAVTEPDKPGRGYLFVIVHGDRKLEGTASILRMDVNDSGTMQILRPLGHKRKVALGEAHHLRDLCENAVGGSARLAMYVDGKLVVTARDPVAMGPFTAALASVIASAPDTTVIFDNVGAYKGIALTR
jgi:hypothetical protein